MNPLKGLDKYAEESLKLLRIIVKELQEIKELLNKQQFLMSDDGK